MAGKRDESTDIDARNQAIWDAVYAIPAGRVASYGAIAQRAGYPGRARLIGKVLGQAPDRSTLPWHRVLRADGHIGIPAGSRGYLEQCRRLRKEGVEGGRWPCANGALRAGCGSGPRDLGLNTDIGSPCPAC